MSRRSSEALRTPKFDMPDSDGWAREFSAFGDWLTAVEHGGRFYGGSYRADTDKRVLRFIDWMRRRDVASPRILECGCFEGGHTCTIARAFPDAAITAVEVREANLERARFLARSGGIGNVTFLRDDLDEPAASFDNEYDAIFCVGLLYHLKEPAAFLKRCAERAPALWLWTVYCAEDEAQLLQGRHRGRIYREPVEHPLSGVRSESFFPTLGSLVEMLLEGGFARVEILEKEMTENNNGPAILLAASRE